MTTFTWKSPVTGFWNDAGVWNQPSSPGSADDVAITASGPAGTSYKSFVVPTVLNNALINDMTVGAQATVVVRNVNLAVYGDSIINHNEIEFSTNGGSGNQSIEFENSTTLTGAGTVVGDAGANGSLFGVTPASSSLTNFDNTISGALSIYNITFFNQTGGVVNADLNSGQLTLDQATVMNAGLLESTGSAGLGFDGVTVANSGVIQAITAGSHVDLGLANYGQTKITGGTLKSANGGYFQAVSGASVALDGGGSSLTNASLFTVQDLATLEMKGSIVNSGVFSLAGATGATSIKLNGNLSLSGGGFIVLGDSTNNQINGLSSADFFSNVDNTILGAGVLSSMTIVNNVAGTVAATDADAALTINTGHTLSNSGKLEAFGGKMIVGDAVAGPGASFISANGTLDFQSTFAENVGFVGGGTLEVAQAYNGELFGFASRDSVDLDFLSPNSVTPQWQQNGAGGVLTVGSAHLNLAGQYQSGQFEATSDGHGGTLVSFRQNLSETHDSNNDARSDIFWQNLSTQTAVWDMNGANIVAASVNRTPGGTWQVVGNGDFDGDGKSDLLLQDATGSVQEWLMNGVDVGATFNLPDPGATWQVKATGDLNGDGMSDIVLQGDDGSVAVWDMNGANLLDAAVAGDPGMTWHVKGTGDFSGNGTADILLQADDGSIGTWEMNGSTLVSGTVLPLAPGAAWHVKGEGDFNGDGKSDIVLQNDDGNVAIWEFNSPTALLDYAVLPDPGATWQVMGVGDFNGDGKSDLLFQNTTDGSAAMWFMNGTTLTQATVLPANTGTAWHPTI